MAILVALSVFITVNYYRNLNTQLFEDRCSHLIEIAEKVSRIIDSEVDSARDKVYTCQQLIQRGEIDGLEQISPQLEEIARYINEEGAVVLAFDQNAAFYASDGHVGYWDDTSIFLASNPVRQSMIAGLPYLDASTVFMTFINRLDEPIPVGGTDKQLTHIALAVNLETLNERLSVQGFGGNSHVYIINETGRRLYWDHSSVDLIEGFNILNVLEQHNFYHGSSIEDLRQAVSGEDSAGFELNFGGTNYFVSVSHIETEEWEVLLFVPTSVLGANTSVLLSQTIQFFATIALLALILCGVVIFTIMSLRNSKKLLKQQEAANTKLAESAEVAERASAAKSEFLSRMSHDIRTPINGIMGMTEIALKNLGDEARVQDSLKKVEGSARHLLELVNDVLDMSRIESGKTKANHEPMDMREALNSCAATISGQLSVRNLEFVLEFEEFAHPRLVGDELHLRQILINILGNAVKFTPDGGRVTFRARELSGEDETVWYHFEVEDTGIGMKAEYLEHIFEPFSQENGGSRTTYQGTGLGMAITKQFVDMLKGAVTVESEPGKGSRFLVELPFEIDRTTPVCIGEQEEEESLEGVRILLVEDNELNMEIAQYLLEDKGVSVVTAENGQAAVELFLESPPESFDAILMDVMMPVMDGLEASRAIRALPRADARKIPIIAMTANAYAEDVEKTRAAGMDAHLSKPINPELMFQTLGKHIHRHT